MSTHRVDPRAGWVYSVQKGADGRPQCRRCGGSCPKGRRTFCGDECVHEWKLRTNSGYLRQQVWLRDAGICGLCGFNVAAFEVRLHQLYGRIKRLMQLKQVRFDRAVKAVRRVLRILVRHRWAPKAHLQYSTALWDWTETMWHADHRVPVVLGGGECGLSNVQTACRPCHLDKSRRDVAEARARKRQEVAGV